MIITLLEKLLEATKKGLLEWKIDDQSENEEKFIGNLYDRTFTIEIIYLPRSDGKGNERSLVRISNNKLYETFAIGTKGYELIFEMLQENILSWKEAKISHEKDISALTKILSEKLSKP